MKQRGVGRPLLRTEFESELLKFFKRGNRSRRQRVPDRRNSILDEDEKEQDRA